MRISDWSSDVCSSDLTRRGPPEEEYDEDDDDGETGRHDRNDHERERKERYPEGDIGDAHDHFIGPASKIARYQSDERADNDAADRRDHADDECDACAPQKLAENVHALIRAAE